jgi:hypothetical protein
VVS